MQHNAIIDANPVEPSRIGFRQPRGARFRCRFTFKRPATIEGAQLQAGPTKLSARQFAAIDESPQIVFRPRSRPGAWGYNLTINDAEAGTCDVEIDGAFFQDPSGYLVEVYTRDSDGRPVTMVAHGEMVMTGAAYGYEGPLGPMTLPVPPAGAPGPAGPAGPASTVPGPAGEAGTRGTMWFTGEGAPVGGENYITGDMWLDQLSGDVWRFDTSMGTWTLT